jgi:hypothetical protein
MAEENKKYPYDIDTVYDLYDKYRDINQVVNMIDGNPETVKRTIVSYRKALKHFSEMMKNNSEYSDIFNDIFEKNEDKYWKKQYKKLLNQMSYEDRIVKLFDSKLTKYKPSRISPKTPIKSSNEIVLLLSDFHAGEVIEPDSMYGLNEYNLDILKERLDNMYSNFINIMDMYNFTNAISTINIWLLGDMVSGVIHEELHQGVNITDEVIITAEYLSEIISYLSQEFANVEVTGIVGNHGRMTQKPTHKDKYCSFDYVMYKFIESKCKDLSNITFNLPKASYAIETIYDYNFFLDHGENISCSGVPFTALKNRSNNLSNIMSYKKDMNIHYYCIGHIHNANILDRTGGKVITNGSLVGYNEYAMDKNCSYSEPKQICFVVNEKYGVNGVFEVPTV